MEKGSVLILTIITVLIMSVIVTGLLTIGTTEIRTTNNYVLKKQSYFHAIQGLEEVIDKIRNTEDPTTIIVEKKASAAKTYYTGDMVKGEQNVSSFTEFTAPQLAGFSLGTSPVPVMYRVPIVAEVRQGSSKNPAVTELEAGVYALRSNPDYN